MAAERQVMSRLQATRFYPFVREHFGAAGLNDEQFAAKAAAELGFPVTRQHVYMSRKDQGIPAFNAQTNEQLAARVDVLERQMAELLNGRLNGAAP